MSGALYAVTDVAEARRRLHSGREIALLDVREAGQFGEAHPLFATPCPYSRLEPLARRLAPRASAPLLLLDAGDGVAERAAGRLSRMGYRDITVIKGGMPAWAEAGFPVYKGVNVPSKTLGEMAEQIWHPQMITAQELAGWQREGRAFAFFDARPPEEYAKMRVPGAACLPNGELPHRLAAAGVGETPVVITCAGRTRGIIGAIGGRLAGHAGPIYALENGTQGWALAGHDLERGNTAERFPVLTDAQLADTRRGAEALMSRFGIKQVCAQDIRHFLSDPDTTTYLLDVRSAEEAAADPVPGAVHALSGQLVQATDQWVAVRHARMVLFDDGGMRAALAAFWVRQLGYEPHVALIDDDIRRMPDAEPAFRLPDARPAPELISAREAIAAAEGGRGAFIDMRSSPAFRKGHVAGAAWFIRPRAAAVVSLLRQRDVLIVADDPLLAALAADDLREAGAGALRLVAGGHAALEAAGAPVAVTPDDPPDTEAIDHLFFVHDRHDGNLEASRRYIEWETGLVAQLDEAERMEFRLEQPS